MNKLFTVALAIGVSMGTSALLANNSHQSKDTQDTVARLALDGAFRDGLYVGRLAAQQGLPMQPLIGRWSSERDRNSFAAGYRFGYAAFLSH